MQSYEQMLVFGAQVHRSLTPTCLSSWWFPKEDLGTGQKLVSIPSLWHLFAEGWSYVLS